MEINIGFSPCPNDTFMFEALVNKRIDTGGLTFNPILADVEELNQMALQGKLDVTKVSYHAMAYLFQDYVLFRSGSALGRNCGPLLISKKEITPEEENINNLKIAIPGKLTTANFLLGIAYPKATNKTPVLFSEIEEKVLDGQFDAGLIIHENRFTYKEKGLHKIIDLGEYWEENTGNLIPLGGIMGKRNLGTVTLKKIEQLIKESVNYAYANPETVMPFVKENAQTMDINVMKKHIDLYVNEYSMDLGNEGEKSVKDLFDYAQKRRLIQKIESELFI